MPSPLGGEGKGEGEFSDYIERFMKYKIFIAFIFVELLILLIFFINGYKTIDLRQEEIESKRLLVKEFMLTDLAIWTEARYTRHPSQADLFTPFQDFPSSIDHFPAGSIMAPSNINEKTKIIFEQKK